MSAFKQILLTYLPRHGIREDSIHDFSILERFLSPIRLQRQTDACLFVSMAACLEMMLRILGIQVPSWDNVYFLDVQDAMDRLCRIYPVADGTGPISMETMLAFVTNYGFKVTGLCKEPSAIDHLANFDDEALRCRIHGHSMLEESEVLKYVEKFPIIAGVYPHRSMRKCNQAFYGGPTEYEKMTEGSFRSQHSVLIVGSMKVDMRSGTQIYLIVQNSWSNTDGVCGFMMLPFDCSDIFTVFVLPHIDPEKFPYRKMENETFQFVERHRRKRRGVLEEGETSRPLRGDDIMDVDPS